MPVFHSPETIELEPAEFGPDEYLAVGRLVRACAVIEDAATLFIASASNMTPALVSILIGQTAISKRLAMGKYLAAAKNAAAVTSYDKLFPAHLKEVIDCRNAVCHGALMGRWPDGKWAFETTKTEAPSAEGVAVYLAYSFATGDIQGFARWAEEIAAATNADPGIRLLREARQRLALQPSRKSQPKPKRGAKPQPPLRS